MDHPGEKKEKSGFSVCLKGLLMGIADVVPGFSGGTVALLTGIYAQLIKSIASFDRQLLGLVLQRKWSDCWKKIDGLFLVFLVLGILGGALIMNLTVSQLLKEDWSRNLTLACFLGLLLAGGWTLWVRLIHSFGYPKILQCTLAILGVCLALSMTLSSRLQGPKDPSMVTLFFSGMLAICAMILPGVSGALILVLLGLYAFLTAIPSNVLHGNDVAGNLGSLVAFGCGCVVGLGSIARLLKIGLKRWPGPIMYGLWGLMIGAVPALWPFQTCLNSEQPKLALRQYQRTGIDLSQPQFWMIVLTVVGSFVLLIVVERLAHSDQSKDLLNEL